MTHYGIDPIDDEGKMSRRAPDVDTIKIERDNPLSSLLSEKFGVGYEDGRP